MSDKERQIFNDVFNPAESDRDYFERRKRELAPAAGSPATSEIPQGSVFLANLHYFFGQTDGSYKWPAGAVGDLLKQAKREIEARQENHRLSDTSK